MKILFLAKRFYPDVGGVEKHVFEVSKRLMELGHEVTVVAEGNDEIASSQAPRNDGRILKQVQDDVRNGGKKWSLIRIRAGKNDKLKKFRIWKWIWENRELIRDADLVHAHDVGFWYWPAVLLFFAKPFFMTFHGWEEKYPIPLKNKIFRKINEKIARGNICVGEFLEKWYGTKADYITYGGVEILPILPILPISNTTNNSIIYVGRLDTDEILGYLEGIGRLKRGFTLTVMGDGERRKEAEEYARKNHLAVEFRGEISPSTSFRVKEMEKADLVFANGYLSILESLAMKKPVFSLYTNQIKKDYLEMTPFRDFINIAGSAEELAREIKEPPSLSLRRAEEGYKWVRTQSWEKVTETYLKLWEKFL